MATNLRELVDGWDKAVAHHGYPYLAQLDLSGPNAGRTTTAPRTLRYNLQKNAFCEFNGLGWVVGGEEIRRPQVVRNFSDGYDVHLYVLNVQQLQDKYSRTTFFTSQGIGTEYGERPQCIHSDSPPFQ